MVTANARSLGFGGADVVTGSVAATLRRPPATAYDVVFADPPYPLADEAVGEDLQELVDCRWLGPGALVVVERSSRSPEPAWPDGFEDVRHKRYGETVLWYGHAASGPAPSEE